LGNLESVESGANFGVLDFFVEGEGEAIVATAVLASHDETVEIRIELVLLSSELEAVRKAELEQEKKSRMI
jgi:hypothetical protein